MIKRSRRSGFSFIELIIVILILGIITAVAAPRLSSSFAVYELELQAHRVAQDIRAARQAAIDQGRTVDMVFDNGAGTYQSLQAGITRAVDDRFTLTANFGGNASLQFDSQGLAASQGASLSGGSLVLAEGPRSVAIELDTGAATISLNRSGLTASR